MKKLILASLTTAALAAGFAVPAATSGSVSHFALGVVQKADRAGGTVTLAHEPVASLKWPAMTMQFSVVEPALLKRLPVGQRVAFEFVAESNTYRIVNAIPLSQSSGAPVASGGHDGMQGGMDGGMHGGMMGQMSDMHEMCMGMMGGGGKRR